MTAFRSMHASKAKAADNKHTTYKMLVKSGAKPRVITIQ